MFKLTKAERKLASNTKSSVVLMAILLTGSADAQNVQEKKVDERNETLANSAASTDGLTMKSRAAARVVRGRGKDLEMSLRGFVLDKNGKPARDFDVSIDVRGQFGRKKQNVSIKSHLFRSWIPVGTTDWFFVEISAQSKDGRQRAIRGLANRELRQATLDGIRLQLADADRQVSVTVKKDGQPTAGAHVMASTSRAAPIRGKTNADGIAEFALLADEKLSQLTAWTDDHRIGGYSFSRKPRRDPLGSVFEIELEHCRDQTVRFLHVDDQSPIANVAFDLTLGTGPPNYNFAGVPATFPHCRMKTDQNGDATCHWFPDWKTHGAYVEIKDPRWATAVRNSEFTTSDDGALIMTLKRRISRKPFTGKVTSDEFSVGGLLVEIKSFQGEEKNRSDHVYSFTDEDGNFSADCLPGATYTVSVNDGYLASKMINLIPYEPDKDKFNLARLEVAEGKTVEIRVTSGPRREPMRDQWVYVRQNHHYSWVEDGKERSGVGARDFPVYTNDEGVAYARALVGSELRVNVYAGEWRSEERTLTVKEEGNATIEFHREVVEQREVKGRLLAPPNSDAQLAEAKIIFGSIDGQTDEREEITADAEGRFSFRTKAVQLGVFAYTVDGKAAGEAKPEQLGGTIELQLRPTMDLLGQLLGQDDEPIAHHAVRVKPRVEGEDGQEKLFATSFDTKAFETRTDEGGFYTLKNLPTKMQLTLRVDPIDDSKRDVRMDKFFLVPGEDRPLMVSRFRRPAAQENRPLAEKHASLLRDANLNGFHALVIVYDTISDDFVGRHLLDHTRTKEIMSFLNLRINEIDLFDEESSKFIESQDWPQPKEGQVFACVLDRAGKELGRVTFDMSAADVESQAAEFLKAHAPVQVDAEAKWNAAFSEAADSGRKVWARIGQRYCGPCFRLSRWLDDNREQIERDYVLLKIDDVRDKHGIEIAKRIVNGREQFSLPFHAIFDSQGTLLIDSEGPTGNIGHPSSFEGRRHLKKMLLDTKARLTPTEIDELIATLE